jgi:hypothetical protein
LHSLSPSCALSLQLEPNYTLWYGKLCNKWWEKPLPANKGKDCEEQLVEDTNNIGLECWMRSARYIAVLNANGTEHVPGQLVRELPQTMTGQ